MTGTLRARVFKRAAVAWKAGRYHEALDILDRAGLREHRMEFVRFAQKVNRDRFERIMARQ